MGVDWKSFWVGAAIAATMAVLHAAVTLPSPYSAIANVLLVVLANLAPSPLTRKAN